MHLVNSKILPSYISNRTHPRMRKGGHRNISRYNFFESMHKCRREIMCNHLKFFWSVRILCILMKMSFFFKKKHMSPCVASTKGKWRTTKEFLAHLALFNVEITTLAPSREKKKSKIAPRICREATSALICTPTAQNCCYDAHPCGTTKN